MGRLEESPDVAGEVALEAADGFAGGLAFGAAPVDGVLGLGVAAGAGDDDAVQCGVDLAVAALVEALSLGCCRRWRGLAQRRRRGPTWLGWRSAARRRSRRR